MYSGAPHRGHVPLIATLKIENNHKKKAVEKLCTDKISWEKWSKDLDDRLKESKAAQERLIDPEALGNFLDSTIQSVTLKHATKKISSCHSKPYWTEELSRLCEIMRAARRKYCKRNTDKNKENLYDSKLAFDNTRKQECQDFLIKKTSKLNSVQALRFWKEFNLIFKKKTPQKIDPLFNEDGDFLTDENDIEEVMFATFFEGQHLQQGNFDDHFYSEKNRIYNKIIHQNPPDDIDNENTQDLNAEITIQEIKAAIKSYQSSGKSSDKENFNPEMFKHLPPHAIKSICKLANLSLKEGKWIWDKAEVIFLKKSGKDTYAKPGSYRPISISSYIGKLIEKILTSRIYKFLNICMLHDPNQEGFMPSRNTIRYLNRLINGIKCDIQKKLTTICLFIDFEKAFDSIWKAGLIVKLHDIGIRGNILKLINDFLVNRKVTININGVVGKIRQTSEVGLPQGSALSPILFRIYLLDILTDIENNENICLYKFADDGTVKVSGQTTEKCLETMSLVLSSIENWVGKNRMLVNCQPDKTEVICFSTAENNKALVPTSFKLCGKNIQLVKHTKALGVIIDEDLNFIEQGKAVHKKLVKKWGTICNYCHRHWGFNHQVMTQIIRTLFLSTLFYAGFLWINEKSIQEIKKLFYKILKSTTGAVFNTRSSLIEIILGIPPINILNSVNETKHYLKLMLNKTPADKLKEFLMQELESEENSVFHHPVRQTMKFLLWKSTHYPDLICEADKLKIQSKNVKEFTKLNPNSCKYTQPIMTKYIEHLWSKSIKNEYQLEGHSIIPNPSVKPLPIPKGISRNIEVLILSLFYENNLLNSFLYRYNPDFFISPLCPCTQEEQTANHLLFRCPLVNNQLRSQAYKNLQLAVGKEVALIESQVILMNASRNPAFMNNVIEIIKSIHHILRSDIILGRHEDT